MNVLTPQDELVLSWRIMKENACGVGGGLLSTAIWDREWVESGSRVALSTTIWIWGDLKWIESGSGVHFRPQCGVGREAPSQTKQR